MAGWTDHPCERCKMIRKIALEEHFMLNELLPYSAGLGAAVNPEAAKSWVAQLLDFGSMRLERMEAAGIERAVLSLPAPGVQQEPDHNKAIALAQFCNDTLATHIAARPDCYSGFAHLPMQAPEAATKELERCVRDLGFLGALVNGQSCGLYLDDPRYESFWACAASLRVPVYLHPGNPVDRPSVYNGQDALWGSMWSWMAETSAHALRLVVGGVFERHPGAQLILGHMGECIPFHLWRLDQRYPEANLMGSKLPHPPSFYIRRNIAITTSGVCDTLALRCSLDQIGAENVLFSVDYPYEDSQQAGLWIENAPLPDDIKAKICHKNAERILNLPSSPAACIAT